MITTTNLARPLGMLCAAVLLAGALSACQKGTSVSGAVAAAAIGAPAPASAASMPPVRFFGDDFAEAYTNLKDKPVEPAPQTF